MNLNAIKRNCVARGVATLYDAIGGGQWISDGVAAWPVECLRLDVDGLEAIFNLTAKQLADTYICERVTSDLRFRRAPMEDEETSREIGAVMLRGELVLALTSSRGMLYIPFNEVRHVKEDYRYYGIRWAYGRPLVAVYRGMMIEALVLPMGNEDADAIRHKAEGMVHSFHWPDDVEDVAGAEQAAEAMAEEVSG